MAQKILLKYGQDDSTFDLNIKDAGILKDGVYNGFDFSPTANMNLSLVHSQTGFNILEKDNTTLSENVGLVLTRHGVRIYEDESLSISIDSTTTLPRIDLIVYTHFPSQSDGGSQALISVIKGNPNENPVAEPLSDIERQVIVGTLTLPINCVALNQVGVSFVKNDVSLFHKGNFNTDDKANVSDLADKANQTDFELLELEVATKAPSSANYAYTDAENAYTKKQKWALGPNITSVSNIVLGDGNTFTVNDGNVSTINTTGQNGTVIVLYPSQTGFNLLHNQAFNSGVGQKPIITVTTSNVALVSGDSVVLIETNVGWKQITKPASQDKFVPGMIMMWGGTLENIPTGWVWADGNNGTKNTKGLFLLGTDDDTYDVGSTGGETEHTLTLDEMPDFGQGSDSLLVKKTGTNTPDNLDNSPDEIDTVQTVAFPTTGGQPHNNMPPYLSIIYIQKIA